MESQNSISPRSPVTKDDAHFRAMFPFGNLSVQFFSSFIDQIICFLVFNLCAFLYILDINSCLICRQSYFFVFVFVFSHSVQYFLTLAIVSLLCGSVLNSMQSPLPVLRIIPVPVESSSGSPCPCHIFKVFSLCCPPAIPMLRVLLILRPLIHI